MKQFDLLEYIGTRKFMLWVTFFAVIVLMPNTYFVYYSISAFTSPWREIFSFTLSLLIASFVMIYTRRKVYRVAKWFGWVEGSLSCYYYIMTIVQSPTLTLWGLIPALVFTIILPVSVYYCALELEKEDVIPADGDLELKTKIADLNAIISGYKMAAITDKKPRPPKPAKEIEATVKDSISAIADPVIDLKYGPKPTKPHQIL